MEIISRTPVRNIFVNSKLEYPFKNMFVQFMATEGRLRKMCIIMLPLENLLSFSFLFSWCPRIDHIELSWYDLDMIAYQMDFSDE